MKILCALAVLVALNGCYTQLLTYKDTQQAYEPAMEQSADSVIDTTADSVHAAATATTYQQQPCTCSEYERAHDLCWCICDKCGTYHRFGYRYCPSHYYSSYWGWDYYYEYPWWYSSYYYNSGRYHNRSNRYYSNDDYYHNYGSPSSGSTPLPHATDKPKKNRGMVDPLTPSSLNKPASESSQPVSQQPASASQQNNASEPSPSAPSKPVQSNTTDKPQKHRGQVDE